MALDATVVIHLAKSGRLDLLGSLEGWAFVVPDQVVEEVTYPDQAAALERALQAGHLRREASTDPAEVTLYAQLKQRMGKGEAACLAVAASRGWMLASDDRGRAFRRLVGSRIGLDRLVDTGELTDTAREQGVISADEASRIRELARH